MKIDYKVQEYDYYLREGNLDAEAKGTVKSEKHFPYFNIEGERIIFKPVSKTKPFATPYFAYSEVIWSNILNYYFDKTIPIYNLAKCYGYENDVPRYHDYGTTIKSLTNKKEKLVNLYEYFQAHTDKNVKIENYINYCLMYYDYSFFFATELFKQNEKISQEIARQILYSILRADQNYHYENVAFICEEDDRILKVASPIDHEFSSIFMYLDDLTTHNALIDEYIKKIISEDNPISKNIALIAKLYPDIIEEFFNKLNIMINDISNNPLKLENHNYIEAFSSNDFNEGILRYKENDPLQADIIKKLINKKLVLPKNINNIINNNIIDINEVLIKKLKTKI